MSSSRSSPSRLTRRALVAAAAAGGAAGVARGVVAQRRHLQAIATDPEYRALTATLGGRPLAPVRSADETQLYAEEFVSDRPGGATLVLAHGWTEELQFWNPVIRRLLGDGLRVVAYDLRGHGRSAPAAAGDYALERFGEDLEAVLVAAGAEPHRTAVAGHSLGAMSIAAWAQGFDAAQRVAAAALVNTGLDDLLGGALLFGEVGSWLSRPWIGRRVLGSSGPLLPVSTPLSQAAVRYIAFGPDASAGAVAFYERMLMATQPAARAAVGIALSTLDLSAAVARITVPTLVVCGDRDRLTPPAHARRIAAALPDPTGLLELERTGHMSPLERPGEVASALRDLLTHAHVASAVAAAG